MLEKTDNRRQRGNRLGGLDFQMSEHGTAQGTSKDGSLRDQRGQRGRGRKVNPGMKIERFFTRAGDDGFRGVEWDLRTAAITGENRVNASTIVRTRALRPSKSWSWTKSIAQTSFWRAGSDHAMNLECADALLAG